MLLRLPAPLFDGHIDREFLERVSRETGTPLHELVALSNQRDPFLAGSPGQEEDAAWFVGLTTGRNTDMHLRDLHYELADDPTSPYQDGDWERLLEASRAARDLGRIEPWAFRDKRTRLIVADGRGDGEEVEYVVTKPRLFVPRRAFAVEAGVDGWVDELHVQPVRVLVTIEKDSEKVLAEVTGRCQRFGAELRVTLGFTPKTLAARLAQDALRDPRPLVVFTITDADARGEHMAVVTARHLEFLARRYQLPPIYLDRIALTLDQVAEIEAEIGKPIPRSPDKTEREQGRVELNALRVHAPGWLGRQVEAALRSVTVEADEPDAGVPEELEEKLDRATQLARRAYERVEDRLREIEEIVDASLAEWEPDEIDFTPPTVEDIDLSRDWVLDPERGYMEQLNAYRRHGAAHRDSTPLVLPEERLCACGCGESIAHLAVQARYLNDAHGKRAKRRRG